MTTKCSRISLSLSDVAFGIFQSLTNTCWFSQCISNLPCRFQKTGVVSQNVNEGKYECALGPNDTCWLSQCISNLPCRFQKKGVVSQNVNEGKYECALGPNDTCWLSQCISNLPCRYQKTGVVSQNVNEGKYECALGPNDRLSSLKLYPSLGQSKQAFTLVKSAYQKYNFLVSQPKHMLWVLKRTVSMRQFL